MTYSIACITPYQELGDVFAEVCRELQKDILIKIGDLEEGVRQALELEEKGIDVVISRGGQRSPLRKM
jgi:hypothetical protein